MTTFLLLVILFLLWPQLLGHCIRVAAGLVFLTVSLSVILLGVLIT